MHIPNPMGSFPLTLRDSNTSSPKPHELLLDYSDANLYFIDGFGEKKLVAQEIYDRIVASSMQNTTVEIYDEENNPNLVPLVSNRNPNHYYFIITEAIPSNTE